MIDTLDGSNDIPTVRTNRNVAYVIRNSSSPMVYVGSTGYPGARVSHHRGNLKRGNHDNKKLQEIYNLYPHIDFIFYEVATREAAYELEKALIEYYNKSDLALNVDLDPVDNVKTSEQLQEFRKVVDAYTEKRSKKVMADGIEYKSLREAARQLLISHPEISRRIKSNKPQFSGWYYVEDGPKTNLGSSRPTNAVLINVNGEEYTLTEYSQKTGIPFGTLHTRRKLGIKDEDLHLPVKRKRRKNGNLNLVTTR